MGSSYKKVASSSNSSEHSTPSSSSLILHFKSKLSAQRHPLQQIRQSAQLTSSIEMSIDEGSHPHRTMATQESNPLPMTTHSIWERRHLHTGSPMEPSNVVKANPPETSKMTTMTGSFGRLQFLTPHRASCQGRKLQRQLSLPMEMIRH